MARTSRSARLSQSSTRSMRDRMEFTFQVAMRITATYRPTLTPMTTALVTGATAGIGYEFARQLAERGHDIVLVARDRVRLENVSDELRRDYKIRSEVLVADLSDRAQIGKVAQRLAEDARPVDLLVNNAGYGMKKGFLANEIEAEEAMLDVLCTSVLVLAAAAASSTCPRWPRTRRWAPTRRPRPGSATSPRGSPAS